jgi:hypothetical protein
MKTLFYLILRYIEIIFANILNNPLQKLIIKI